MNLERRIEELRQKLAAHDEVKLLIGVRSPDPDVEPTWIAFGGSDAAKAEAIEEARRAWREARGNRA